MGETLWRSAFKSRSDFKRPPGQPSSDRALSAGRVAGSDSWISRLHLCCGWLRSGRDLVIAAASGVT